jgi:hypothetical protein
MTADYGVDVSCWDGKNPPDLDPYFRLIRGKRLLCEVALRRVFCLPGSYTQAPGFKSIDLMALVNKAESHLDTAALSEQASAAIRADERFDPAATLATITLVDDKLTAKLQLGPADGSPPFQLTATVANVKLPSPLFQIAFPPETS